MTLNTPIRVALVIALTVAGGAMAGAQTRWPAAKAKAAVSTPAQARKPASVRRRARAMPRPAATSSTAETALLRSMAELVTRQAAAIEVLSRRLEAAEARLDALEPAQPAVTAADVDPAQSPCRAFLTVDWNEVIGR